MNGVRQTDLERGQLDAFIQRYEQHLVDVPGYGDRLLWLIARYSRGATPAAMAADFPALIDKVVEDDALNRSIRHATAPYFTHDGKYAGVFRDALVLLSWSVCLRMPADETRRLLGCCERGDPLLEALAYAATGESQPVTAPAFPQFFAELYAALAAPAPARAELIARYLATWPRRLHGFGFLIAQQDIGYWCFEAAGIAVALNVDDRVLAAQPHYPQDLAAFARQR